MTALLWMISMRILLPRVQLLGLSLMLMLLQWRPCPCADVCLLQEVHQSRV